MVKFIIIRHGYSCANKTGKFAGATDAPLDEIGYKQAEVTKEYILKNFKIDSVYSSDLSRAYDTVKPISDAINLKVNKEKKLREINVGLWEGKNLEEIEKEFPKSYDMYMNNHGIADFDGGETYFDVICRAKKAIEEIAAKNEGKTVLIGTHGGVIRAMQAAWSDCPPEALKKASIVSNCSVTTAQYADGKLSFIKLSYEDHLKDLLTQWHNI